MNEEAQNSKSPLLIIGVGNDNRGDDAVGLFMARALKARHLPDTVVVEVAGDATALIEAWKDVGTVIVFDAVCSGAVPGTIHRFDAHAQPVPTRFLRYSTHAFGVAEVIELARALGRLPPRLIVYGVEGKAFEAGAGLSLEVGTAARQVVERVVQEVKAAERSPSSETENRPENPAPTTERTARS